MQGSKDSGVDNAETLMSFDYEEPPVTQDIPESLNGTSWISTDIAALGTDIIKPITLTFGSSFIYGTTGCNRYRVEYEELADNSFLVVGDTMSITRMYCELTMEQERNYISFLENSSFSYETVLTSNESGAADLAQLVLYDNEAGVWRRGCCSLLKS